jgi:hypothetical protein
MKNIKYIALFFFLGFNLSGAYSQKTESKKPYVADSNVTFVRDGVTMVKSDFLTCGSYENLNVVYVLPANAVEKYDKLKFFLYINDDEFKSKDYQKHEFENILKGGTTFEAIAVSSNKKVKTSFDNFKTEYLGDTYICKDHTDDPKRIYKVRAVAKGYIKSGENKRGSKQEVITQGEMTVKLSGK